MRKLLLPLVCLAFITPAFSENVTLTTYYPAPSGAYKALRSHGMCVGASCTHALISDNNLSVQGRIGIGTTAPGYAFQVGTGTSTHGMPTTGVLINNDLEVHGTIWGDGSNLTGVVAAPAGADKEVQYNNNAVAAGATNFVFDQNTGNVGIGASAPIAKLDIMAEPRVQTHPAAVPGLYVTGAFGAASNGVEFRHTNGTQGIGFGYNTIYATGTSPDQHLNLLPKGNGRVGIGDTMPAGKLDVAGFGGMIVSGANLDPNGGYDLTPLKNSGKLLIGWNRSGGLGEIDFISNRGPGAPGGFRFYDYDNNGTLTLLATINTPTNGAGFASTPYGWTGDNTFCSGGTTFSGDNVCGAVGKTCIITSRESTHPCNAEIYTRKATVCGNPVTADSTVIIFCK